MTTRGLITLITLMFAGFGSPAWADNETDVRQKRFEADKQSALAAFNSAQRQACIQALQARYQSRYRLNDSLAFNEPWSLTAYDRLFWKGKGHARRGLIFTGSVTNASGAEAGRLFCYYAMTDNHLDFQSAYVLPVREKGSEAARSEQGKAPPLAFAGRE